MRVLVLLDGKDLIPALLHAVDKKTAEEFLTVYELMHPDKEYRIMTVH